MISRSCGRSPGSIDALEMPALSTLSNAMSITPEPPLKTEGRSKHGSVLNGKIGLRRVSSQWVSKHSSRRAQTPTRQKRDVTWLA